jgi:hypothetical protein
LLVFFAERVVVTFLALVLFRLDRFIAFFAMALSRLVVECRFVTAE